MCEGAQNRMIDIKDISGNILYSVLPTQENERVEELMKQDYVELSWYSDQKELIPAGAYIEYGGEKFSLLEPYSPLQNDELKFTYSPQFQSRIMGWGKILFFMYSYDASGNITGRETDWSLTDNPTNFMAAIVSAIENETGEKWTYSVDASLPASSSLTFQNVYILSALNMVSSAFGTEWWTDKNNKVLHLSKASHGEPVTVEVGVNVGTPTVTNSKEGYYTRFYAFGSTRNIVQDYKGANVNNLVNKRLTLDPVKYPKGYKDIRPNLAPGEIFSKALFFDDIYPSSNLSISNVRVRLMWKLGDDSNKIQIGTDENGNPIYDQYAIWYFRVPGFTLNNTTYDEESNPNGMLIPEKKLSVHFETGALQGREFELIYHDKSETVTSADGTSIQILAGDYEIKFVEESSYIIPSVTGLVPADGNEIILFNIRMPDEYTSSAYQKLEDALDKEIEHLSSDLNNYELPSYPDKFKSSNPNLKIGSKVLYKNREYSYSTRVIKLVTKLDFDFIQTITIGNEIIKGNTQELKEEVVNANKDLNLLAAINDMTLSIQQAYNRTQQMMLDGFAAIKDIWQLKEDEEGNKYAFSAYDVVTEKGLTMYADGSNLNLPSIYAGLPIDGTTIGWVDGKLSYIGGGTGGSTTLGGLTNVGSWADVAAPEDRVLFQAKDSTQWSSKLLSELVGSSISGIKVNNETYAPGTDGYITIPDYPTSLDWDEIDNKPTWIGSTKPSYAWSEITGKPSWIGDTKPSYAFREITDTPTTLAGYGITDAYSQTDVDNRYVKKAGDTMTGSLKFTGGADGRTVELSNSGSLILTGANAGWASGLYYKLYGGTTIGYAAAAYGTAAALSYYYYGGSYTNPAMAILPNGNVGIGTTSPTSKLHVAGDMNLNGIPIKKHASGVLEIDGDLIVTGGVTMYAQGSYTASTILDALPIDDTTLSKADGKLSVIGGGGSGINGIYVGSTLYTPDADKYITLGDYYNAEMIRTANTVLAAPNGSNGSATFRKLVVADIPSLPYSKISDAPASLKNPYALTITLPDGSTTTSYDGSAAKSLTLTRLYKSADVDSATTDSGTITPYAMNTWTKKQYVTALGTSGNYLTWTKNGATNNITVPYATNSLRLLHMGRKNWNTLGSATYNGIFEYYDDSTLGRWYSYGSVLQFSNVDAPSPGTNGHWITQLISSTENTIGVRWRTNTGYWSSPHAIRTTFNLGGIADYGYAVIGLCPLTNTDIQALYYSYGEIYLHRVNGLFSSCSVRYNVNKVYNSTSAAFSLLQQGNNFCSMCTFTYNGVKYAGLRVYPGAAQVGAIYATSFYTGCKPFLVYYYSTNDGVINEEINSSIVVGGDDIQSKPLYGTYSGSVTDLTVSGVITKPGAGKAYAFGADGAYIGSNTGTDFYLWCNSNIRFRLGTNNTERITVLGNGNVGIGTTSPDYALHVNGGIKSTTLFNRTTYAGSGWGKGQGAYNVSILNNSNQTSLLLAYRDGNSPSTVTGSNRLFDMELLNTGTELRFYFGANYTTFTSAGNIGSTYYLLNNSATNPYLRLTLNSVNWYTQAYQRDSVDYLYVGAGSANSLRIDTTGNVLTPGGVTMYSDIRKKDVLEDVMLPLEMIAEAPLFSYTYKGDKSNTLHIGTSAQYWQDVPGIVRTDGEDGYLTMDYNSLLSASVFSLAKYTMRHETEIERLKRENKEMRQRINELERRAA